MISLLNLARELLTERMSFTQLFNSSTPSRKARAKGMTVSKLPVLSSRNERYWNFSFKSAANNNTTGKSWKGRITFPKSKDVSRPDRLMCEVDCSCFSPDTLVLMSDGTYKKIIDVKIGDFVYTHTGKIQKVLNNRAFTPTTDVYKIKAVGFPESIICTSDHPFYVLRGNEYCTCGCKGELKNSLMSPKYLLRSRFLIGHGARGKPTIEDNSKGIFKWVPANLLKETEWFFTPWFVRGEKSVDLGLAKLLGYYAAEGCPAHNPNSKKGSKEIRITLNQNEADTIAKDVINICNRLNYPTKVHYRSFLTKETGKINKWLVVSIYSHEFKNFCLKHAGTGSHDKKFSVDVMSWNNDCLREVLTGLILGDGSIDLGFSGKMRPRIRYCSSSFDLISQASTMLGKLKISHSITKANKKTLLVGHSHQITLSDAAGVQQVYDWMYPQLREKSLGGMRVTGKYGISRDEGQLRRSRSIQKIKYTELVYDLTVERDESFIANGIAVHNCPDYKYRWAYANSQQDAGPVGFNSLNKSNGQAAKITNPKNRPGLCKHLLGLKDGLKKKLSESNQPTLEGKLNEIVDNNPEFTIDVHDE